MSQTHFNLSYTTYPFTNHSSEQDTQGQQDVIGCTFPFMTASADGLFRGYGNHNTVWAPQPQAQWSNEDIYYRQAMMSPSAMTSETSNTDSSNEYPYYMARSASGSTDYDDHWSQVASPAQMPMGYLHPQNELLSNMGSEFTTITQMTPLMFRRLDIPEIPEVTTREIPDSDWTLIQGTYNTNNTTTSHNNQPKAPTQDPSTTSMDPPPSTRRGLRPRRRKPTPPLPKTRVYCPICLTSSSKDYTRGFKGEHELARHHAQKHSPHREVFYIVDRSPTHLLRNCERCRKGHIYGSEYGGAEHMRRKHSRMFGAEMMERLKGCTRRTALSKNRLRRHGWLEAKWIINDGCVDTEDVEGEQEQEQDVESFVWVQQQQWNEHSAR